MMDEQPRNIPIRGHIIIGESPTLTAAIWDAVDYARTEEGADIEYRAITGDVGSVTIELKSTHEAILDALPRHKRMIYPVYAAYRRMKMRVMGE